MDILSWGELEEKFFLDNKVLIWGKVDGWVFYCVNIWVIVVGNLNYLVGMCN